MYHINNKYMSCSKLQLRKKYRIDRFVVHFNCPGHVLKNLYDIKEDEPITYTFGMFGVLWRAIIVGQISLANLVLWK